MAGKVVGMGIWPGRMADGKYLSDHNGVFVDVEV
jgi:hypothetical protein